MAANDRFRLMERFAGAADNRLPKELKFPNVEIGEFMALSMGMLDLGTRVLTDPKASVGWKVLALAEAMGLARMLDALNTLPKPLIGKGNGQSWLNILLSGGVLGSISV